MGKTNTWAEAFLVFTMLESVYALAITVFWAIAVILGWY